MFISNNFIEKVIKQFEFCMAIVNCRREYKPTLASRYSLIRKVRKDGSTIELALIFKEYKDFKIILQPKESEKLNIKAVRINPQTKVQNGSVEVHIFDCKNNDKSGSIYTPYIIRVGVGNTLSLIEKSNPIVTNLCEEDKFYDIIECE